MKVVDEQAPNTREKSDRAMRDRTLNWRNFMVVGELSHHAKKVVFSPFL
jgi:hypothetical protein